MANVLIIKRSAVAAKVPTTGDLQLGELAINTYDGKLYLKKDNGTASIVEVGALPQALGTGDSPQFAGINVGNASDTTITRSSAGVLAVEGGIIPKENRANTYSGLQTFNGGLASGFTVNKQDTTGEGGQFQLQKSDTSTLSGDLAVDLYNNTLRFFEAGGTARGAYIDVSAQAASAASKILTSAGANVDYAIAATVTTYTSGSGNWTIPSVGTFAWVRLWGGGGSGGRGGASYIKGAGGGGGGYKEFVCRLSSLGNAGATISYSVGAGGTGVSVAGAGNTGGNTTFNTGEKQIVAYGGGGGAGNQNTSTGGLGGLFSAASNSGSGATSMANLWAGGQGATIQLSSIDAASPAVYGGGGGGSGRGTVETNAGASSIVGGAGGAGALSGAPGNGTAPGGGGGGLASNSGTSGSGANGRIEIWVW